jgi:alkylation response protein AidB-like acyl-CoA dehydrogenase
VRFAGGALTGGAANLLDGASSAVFIVEGGESDARRLALAAAEDAEVEATELVDRTRGLATARFAGAAASVLNADAEAVARDIITHASLAIACDSIGGAKAVLDLTVAYLKTREQFGKPIGSFQALKHRCAEHKVAIEAADALVRDAVERWARDAPDAALSAALAKALACDVYATVATDAVQLHGGIGFTWEHVCHLYLKRAKLNQTLFGGSAGHRDLAAQLLLAA